MNPSIPAPPPPKERADEASPARSQLRFDRLTLRRFWSLTRLMFASQVRWTALGLLALIIGISLSLSGFNVLRSYADRDFMNALSRHDYAGFLTGLKRYGLLFGAMVPLAVFYRYAEERLALFWRNWLSRHVIDAWLANGAYYRVGIERQIDNPDQRIEEDIRTFTSTTLSLTLILLNSCVSLIAFVSILYSISGLLLLGAVVYALLGSLLTYYLGRPLIDLTYAQLKKDGNYRYKLVTVRDFSESIAFYRGGSTESVAVKEGLARVVRNTLSSIGWSRNLGFLTHSYNYVLAILPTVLVAPLYFRGQMEFGTVVQAGVAFGQVLGALSVIVVHFSTLSSLAAVTTRVGTFWESVGRASHEHEGGQPQIRVEEADAVSFAHVTLFTPDHQQRIVEDLSFSLGPEDRLLVAGPSGAGKSSLLRLLGGLWSSGSGVLHRPASSHCMFVPQRAYLPAGTFLSQFLYGTGRASVDREELEHVIHVAGLDATAARFAGLDRDADWKSLLSAAEQELVAFARVFLGKPAFVFLDEASDAVHPELRALLYAELQRLGVRYLSTGPRVELDRFHNRLLALDGKGGWELGDLGPV